MSEASSNLPASSPATEAAPSLPGAYRPRRPEQTVLYQCVQENYRSFLALYEEQDRGSWGSRANAEASVPNVELHIRDIMLSLALCGVEPVSLARTACLNSILVD